MKKNKSEKSRYGRWRGVTNWIFKMLVAFWMIYVIFQKREIALSTIHLNPTPIHSSTLIIVMSMVDQDPFLKFLPFLKRPWTLDHHNRRYSNSFWLRKACSHICYQNMRKLRRKPKKMNYINNKWKIFSYLRCWWRY